MSSKRILSAIIVMALCTLACQALASVVASPTPPPSPTAAPTDTPEPSPTISPTPPPGEVIPPDSALKIPGMASMVGSGTCAFAQGEKPGENTVSINGTIPVVDEQYCPCCVNQITIAADMKIPLDLFLPRKPPQAAGLAGASVQSVKMDAPALIWTNAEDLSTYILSGPEGAKLEKVDDGFLLKDGAAYFVQGPEAPATATAAPTRTPSPQPKSTATPTPEPDRVFEPQGGFSYLPPKGWSTQEVPGFDYKVASGPKVGDFIPNLFFLVNTSHRGTLDQYVSEDIEYHRSLGTDPKVISQEDFETNEGKRGVKVVEESVQRNMNLRNTFYYFESDTRKFVATYTRKADQGQDNDALVDQSMKTFRPEAGTGSASQPSSVKMLNKAEAQKMLEEQDIESLGSKVVERYSQEERDRVSMRGGTLTYTINLTQSEPLVWSMGWCSTTEETLAQNFDHIRYTFTLDGQDISTDQFVKYEYYSENTQGYCRVYRTILTDWAPGEHTVQTVTTMDQPINDGWDDYDAGQRTYIYRVTMK